MVKKFKAFLRGFFKVFKSPLTPGVLKFFCQWGASARIFSSQPKFSDPPPGEGCQATPFRRLKKVQVFQRNVTAKCQNMALQQPQLGNTAAQSFYPCRVRALLCLVSADPHPGAVLPRPWWAARAFSVSGQGSRMRG